VETVQIVPPGRIVFGLQLPVVAQTTFLAQPWEAAAGPAEVLRVAQEADRLGFFSVSVSDHVAIPRDKAATMSTVWYDAVATLGFVAAATTRVKLLSHVYVLPYRHPLQTAKAFATLDALSGGRVVLGVGAGHVEAEFAAFGVDVAERGRLLDEAIVLVAATLRDEWPVHEGRHWRVHDLGVAPRPVQRPRPPIWVGGSTPAALRRAARLGDGWLPQGTPRAELPQAIAFLREHRRRLHGDAPITVGAMSDWLYVGTPGFSVPPGTRTGGPDAIAGSLRELAALGVQHCGVRFRTRSCDELVDQIQAFARDVVPLVNA
jgi:probable F420-dependent oxidoreductase